jgi:cobalt-zinc-cadmium efflux system outer membrane protein
MRSRLKESLNCRLLLLLFCLGFSLITRGQSPEGPATATGVAPTKPKLYLVDAKRVAFERNWDLLAAKSGVDTAAAQQMVVREFPNPIVSAFSSKINTDGNPNNTPQPHGNGFWHRSYDTIFAVSQLVEIGGKRSSRQSSAKAGIVGARARFYDARRLLDQGLTKAYVAALLAEDNMRILNESAESLQREAGLAGIRFKAGDISDSDKKQIEINAERFQLDAQTAEVAAASARIAVEVLMGVEHPRGDWVPADSLDRLVVVPAEDTGSQSDAARPDLLAAEADLRRSKADLRLQKAIRIPDPTFSLQFEHQPPDQPNTVGFGISFPLPLWNLNQGGIKAAQAAEEQTALQIGKVKAQIASDIATAELAYRDASERLQRYQNQIRPKSAKVREAVAFAYEKGGASLVDLLTAERDDNGVRLATTQAMSDSAMAAADLIAARNVLSETELTARK